jgi:hypothetical protein
VFLNISEPPSLSPKHIFAGTDNTAQSWIYACLSGISATVAPVEIYARGAVRASAKRAMNDVHPLPESATAILGAYLRGLLTRKLSSGRIY